MQEKCRVLEEALNVLAKEHHALEQSVAEHISESGLVPDQLNSPRFYDTDDDEFHDAFDADSDSDSTTIAADSMMNSRSESLQDLDRCSSLTPYNPLLYTSSGGSASKSGGRNVLDVGAGGGGGGSVSYKRNKCGSGSSSEEEEEDRSFDTLVDAASMVSVSLASSCGTYISDGGDAYKCARSEFVYRKKPSSSRNRTRFPFPADAVVPFKSR